jgi:hypothetical protein
MEVYKSYLKAKYLERKMPHYGKWPDLPTEKYINMSVIEKGKPTKDDSKALTYGNIDAVKRKSDIAFEDLAKPAEDGLIPKFVLVEGAPGVGKTTFAWEACRKWAEGEILQNFDLVILARLRDRSVRSAKCLGDIIQYPRDARIQSEIVREVSKSGGKGVLLLFEGYDELPASLRQDGSLFRNIIQNGCEFDEGTVMVTSRHWASEPFLFPYSNPSARAVSQHIEILGFTTRNIEDYISSMLCDELLRDMKEYLELCPHIHSMMYIPLNCAIVLEVYKTSKKHNTLIPKTTTELYSSLIRSLLLRYICDLPEYQDKVFRIDLKSLPACVRNHFSIITELAYEAIFDRNQQIIFSEDDVPSDFNSLGLMQSAMELYVDVGATTSYNFLHLTIQEFLAAHHISTLPVQQQVEFYNRAHAENLMVITFPAGLSPISFQKFLTDSSCTKLDGIPPHLNIRCSFEARLQPRSAIAITETLHDPFTSYMLGYLICKTNFCWKVTIRGYEDTIHFFVRGILSSGLSKATIALTVFLDQQDVNSMAGLSHAAITADALIISGIHIHGKFQRSDIDIFFNSLVKGDSLVIKQLSLECLTLDDMQVNHFKSYLESSSLLTRLTLEECTFQSADGEALLAQGLQACSCLKNLAISFPYPGDDTIFRMLNINENKSLEILEVNVCTHQQLCELFTALCDNNTINELIVKGKHFRNIGKSLRGFFEINDGNLRVNAAGHEIIDNFFSRNTGLKSLTLNLRLCSADIRIVSNALHEDSIRQQLTIPTCDGNGEAISNMLRRNRTLKELRISRCLMTSACEIAKELCRNDSLEKLSLRIFQDKGVEAFASVIKQNTTLKELEISGYLTDRQWMNDLIILSNALGHNRTLVKLNLVFPRYITSEDTELANSMAAECAKDKRLTIQTKPYM